MKKEYINCLEEYSLKLEQERANRKREYSLNINKAFDAFLEVAMEVISNSSEIKDELLIPIKKVKEIKFNDVTAEEAIRVKKIEGIYFYDGNVFVRPQELLKELKNIREFSDFFQNKIVLEDEQIKNFQTNIENIRRRKKDERQKQIDLHREVIKDLLDYFNCVIEANKCNDFIVKIDSDIHFFEIDRIIDAINFLKIDFLKVDKKYVGLGYIIELNLEGLEQYLRWV